MNADMTNGAKPKKRFALSNKGNENFWGYLFILPNLIGFCVFTLFGIVFSLIMAFTDWNLLKGIEKAQFVGFKNFIDMWGDPYLVSSLRNHLILLLVIPITLILAAVLATIMNKAIYGKAGARALYFLPYVTNMVAIATVWQALFHKSKGPINSIIMALTGLGAEEVPGWLASSKWVLPALMIILVWQNIGYDILMYSSAIQSIPTEYLEAAEIDGAGPIKRFFKINSAHDEADHISAVHSGRHFQPADVELRTDYYRRRPRYGVLHAGTLYLSFRFHYLSDRVCLRSVLACCVSSCSYFH